MSDSDSQMSHGMRKQCGFRTGPTQTELCKHRRWLEAGNIVLEGTYAKLIFAFVFPYAN